MTGRIRLACLNCDRQDCDGVAELPPGWQDMGGVQSYEESIREIDPNDRDGSVFAWYTHLGLCPDCQRQYLIH